MTSKYEIIQINDNSWRIEDAGVRCFLFEGSSRSLLVDSGKTLTNTKALAKSLTKKTITLINTHADADHIACNEQFESFYMHPAEYPFYLKNQKRGGTPMPIWDGDKIDLGGRIFEVITTPGHTDGSIALLNKNEHFLVGGDGIQDGRIFLFGNNRDLLAYQYSLEKIWQLQKYFDVVYPSHGSFPVPASIIPELLSGVSAIRNGRIHPKDDVFADTPIKSYNLGTATILYDDFIHFE